MTPEETTQAIHMRLAGLAIAYGIVRSHGGFVRFQTEAGHGSTFEVILST